MSPFRQGFNAYVSRPRFTQARPATIPFEAYTVRRSGVPLQGGQAQGTVGGPVSGTGSVTAPVAFVQFLVLGPYPPGTYTINWTLTLSGTAGAGDANNVRLNDGDPNGTQTILATSVNAGAAGTYPQAAQQITLTSSTFLIVKNVAASTATYAVTITVTGTAALTLQIGPQGAGTVWYPAQVTTFTTSGVNDTSTCLIYMGAAGTPVTLMGTLFPGGAGVLAVAFPPLTVGLFVIAKFTGANNGDVAAVNVTGTMDYLDTAA